MDWTDPYGKEIKLRVTELYFDDNDSTEQKIATSAEVSDMLKALVELRHLGDPPHRWTVGEAVPGLDNFRILALFDGEGGDVYAYCYPLVDASDSSKEWRRYTINRMGFLTKLEVMTRATFVDEVVQEFEGMLDSDEDEEPEPQVASVLPS